MIDLILFRKQLIESGWNPTMVYSMTDEVLIYYFKEKYFPKEENKEG